MPPISSGTNIAALGAQRRLAENTANLRRTSERLSSGLRINRASDDAAGLAISESLKAETRIANQGIRNINDGVGLLSVADGALGELSSITIRLRELATQSANGTFSYKQRLALDTEAQSLAREYNRIARSTQLNGQNLFDPNFGELSIAAGGGQNTLIAAGLGGAVGDGTFLARTSFSIPLSTISSVIFADVNEDGIQDLVSNGSGSNAIAVLLGNGDGSYGAATTFVATNSNMIVYSDFNGDGFVDLATGSHSVSKRYSIFFGNGNGTFKAEVSQRTSGDNKRDLEIADFNADGIADIAASGGPADNQVEIFLGNGDGTFVIGQRIFSAGSDGLGLVKGDLDNDGDIDLVHMTTGQISVLKNNGDGTFSFTISFAATGAGAQGFIADLNNDGVMDLLSMPSPSSPQVFLGNNDGTFLAPVSYAGGTAYAIDYGDFNADGAIDLATASTSNTLDIRFGNGNGTFLARVSYAGGSTPFGILVEDTNNDGVDDLITPNAFVGVSVLLGNSTDGVAALKTFSLKSRLESTEAMEYFKGALSRIANHRGQVGAFQSRVQVAVNTLQTAALNFSEANSRITDADMAEETARLTAIRILQQASAGVLAQANLQPRLVLDLLGDV